MWHKDCCHWREIPTRILQSKDKLKQKNEWMKERRSKKNRKKNKKWASSREEKKKKGERNEKKKYFKTTWNEQKQTVHKRVIMPIQLEHIENNANYNNFNVNFP